MGTPDVLTLTSSAELTMTDRQSHHTNLASEFYVLSQLHRQRLSAGLTLANQKGVDIVVSCGNGRAFTVEVKAVAGKNDWLVGKLGVERKDHHFVVLVSFEGKFDELAAQPRVWVFAHDDLVPLVSTSKTGSARYISRKTIRDSYENHEFAWELLTDAAN